MCCSWRGEHEAYGDASWSLNYLQALHSQTDGKCACNSDEVSVALNGASTCVPKVFETTKLITSSSVTVYETVSLRSYSKFIRRDASRSALTAKKRLVDMDGSRSATGTRSLCKSRSPAQLTKSLPPNLWSLARRLDTSRYTESVTLPVRLLVCGDALN